MQMWAVLSAFRGSILFSSSKHRNIRKQQSPMLKVSSSEPGIGIDIEQLGSLQSIRILAYFMGQSLMFCYHWQLLSRVHQILIILCSGNKRFACQFCGKLYSEYRPILFVTGSLTQYYNQNSSFPPLGQYHNSR